MRIAGGDDGLVGEQHDREGASDLAERIDDPSKGWKGRGLWATTSTRTMFHLEGGKENRPKVVKFQMRPDPLAK